ncbi:hypothetical protein [Streptomyces sp. NPDC017991]|uniref:hypothetical protein n=1 Tax=Streptomyces sp. NPDC017991 TaxID=3365026 RepID=UPI00379F5878
MAGRCPRAAGARVVETAPSEVFAAELAVRPGDELRVRPGSGPQARMAGLYQAGAATARPSGRA